MSNKGIGYFSLDTDFFQDKKVKLIRGEFGAKGVVVLIHTLCAIYSDKGYYMEWGEDDCYLASQDLGCGCSPALIGEVVNRCVKRGLFNEKVFNTFGVLTSHGIQIRFFRAAARRERISIIKEYMLFDLNELNASTRIKVTLFSKGVDISNENAYISNENVNISPVKKESKEREKEREGAARAPMFNIEKAWEDTFAVYPKKTNFVAAHTAWLDKLAPVLAENRKAVAVLIASATKLYIDDYRKRNPDDAAFRYVPKYDNWLKNDCDYWIREYEKMQKAVAKDG